MKISIILSFTGVVTSTLFADTWKIESEAGWKNNIKSSDGITIENNSVSPTRKNATLKTKLKKFKKKKRGVSLTLRQSPAWQNWKEVPSVGPSNLRDAPVFLSKGPKDYWILARFSPKS